MSKPTEWDISALRLQGDLPAYLRAAHAKAVADCKQRRARIVVDRELADRLIDTLRLTAASQWSGYVPPERDATGRLNASPIRQALVALAAEAEGRAS